MNKFKTKNTNFPVRPYCGSKELECEDFKQTCQDCGKPFYLITRHSTFKRQPKFRLKIKKNHDLQ